MYPNFALSPRFSHCRWERDHRFQTNLKIWKPLWIISREGLCERIRLNPTFVEERLNYWTYGNSHTYMRHRRKGRESRVYRCIYGIYIIVQFPSTKPVLFTSRFQRYDVDNDVVFAVLTLRFDIGRIQFLDFGRASLSTSHENYPAIQ